MTHIPAYSDIDKTTGLPAVGEGFFWRIREENYWDKNFWFLELRLKRRFWSSENIKEKMIFEYRHPALFVPKDSTIVETAVHLINMVDTFNYHEHVAMRKAANKAARIKSRRDKKAFKAQQTAESITRKPKVTAEEKARKAAFDRKRFALAGNYPPKSLKDIK